MVDVGHGECLTEAEVALDRLRRCQKPLSLPTVPLVAVKPPPRWTSHVTPADDPAERRADLTKRNFPLGHLSAMLGYPYGPGAVVEGAPVGPVHSATRTWPERLGHRHERVADVLRAACG